MVVSTKGQVTIPQYMREKLGLLPDTEIEFDLVGDSVRIRKAHGRSRRGARLIAHMAGRGSVRMTTDQIMALTRGEP